MLDSCGTILDNTRRALTGLYHWAKFRWNRSRNFDKIEVWIFCTFGLKTLIHAPNCFFLGGGAFVQQNGVQYQCDPQRAHPCVETSHMTCRSSKLVKQLLRYSDHFHQDGSRPQSCISGAHFGTTCEYLKVFIIVQDLAGITVATLIEL